MAKGKSKLAGTSAGGGARSTEDFINDMVNAMTRNFDSETEYPMSNSDLQGAVEAFAMMNKGVDEDKLLDQIRDRVERTETIKKYGFESKDEFMDYVNNNYFTQNAPNLNKLKSNVVAKEILDGVVLLQNNGKNRNSNAELATWLKEHMNVSTESYGGGEYLVSLKRGANGNKKRKRPKSVNF